MKRVKDGKVEPVFQDHSITESSRQLNDKQLLVDADELDLSLIKPVLKRNFFHMGNSVIVSWKSFEVWLVSQDANMQNKVLNPIYLPLTTTRLMLQMNEQELKTVIERGLKQSSRGFVFSQPQKLLNKDTLAADI